MLPYLLTKNSVTVFNSKNVPHVADSSHPNFNVIINELKSGEFSEDNNSFKLFDLSYKHKFVYDGNSGFSDEEFIIDRSGVKFNGQLIHNTICDRIVENWTNGLPIDNLVNFLRGLLNNPYDTVVQNLYSYLEKYQLAINEAGNIVGIKAVNPNLTSIFSPSFQYPKAGIVSEPLHLLEKNPLAGCGRGLYFGFHDFVFNYGHSDSQVLALEIDPAHIIGIPQDSGYQKMRAHTLNVLGPIGTVAELRGKFKAKNVASKVPEFAKFTEAAKAFMSGVKLNSKGHVIRDSKGCFTPDSAIGAKRNSKGQFTK